MKAAVKKRIEALQARLAPRLSFEALAIWQNIVDWSAGDHSPEQARRLGPWGPAGLASALLRILPASKPGNWPTRARVAWLVVAEELLESNTPAQLKKPAGLAIALKEVAALICAPDWPPIIENATTCGDGTKCYTVDFHDRREHYTVTTTGRIYRLGPWDGSARNFAEVEMSRVELDRILDTAIRG